MSSFSFSSPMHICCLLFQPKLKTHLFSLYYDQECGKTRSRARLALLKRDINVQLYCIVSYCVVLYCIHTVRLNSDVTACSEWGKEAETKADMLPTLFDGTLTRIQ